MKLPARALGIEFAEGRIHFVEMRRMLGKPRIHFMHTLDLAGATGEDEVAERMSAFLAEKGVRSRRVVAGIPLKDAMVRVIQLPGVEEKHLRQMLEFELDRHFPLAPDEVYFDYQELLRGDDQVKLLVVAIERRTLDRYRGLIAQAGLPTTSITPSVLADASLISGAAEGTIQALLRNTISSMEIAVLQGAAASGIFRFPRPNGSATTTQEPAEAVAAATGALRQSCVSATRQPQPGLLITSGRNLSAEVAEGLAEELCLESIGILGETLALQEEQTHYTTGAALAQWGLNGIDDLPNLLPEEQRSGDTGLSNFLIAAQLGLVLLLAALLLGGMVVREKHQLSALEVALTELQPEVQRIRSMEEELREQKGLVDSFSDTDRSAESPLVVVRQLARLAQRSVWITDLNIDGNKITITGRAKENDDLQELKILLGGDPMFSDVAECSKTRRPSDGQDWRFKLCGTLASGGEGEGS